MAAAWHRAWPSYPDEGRYIGCTCWGSKTIGVETTGPALCGSGAGQAQVRVRAAAPRGLYPPQSFMGVRVARCVGRNPLVGILPHRHLPC